MNKFNFILIKKKILLVLVSLFLFNLRKVEKGNLFSNNKRICDHKNNNDFYNGYYVKEINDFLTLNNEEKLIEKIPSSYIKKPIFSIIMPFYLKNDTIKKSIRSIQNQNFKSYEILLIDDMSTDNSLETVINLSTFDKRIKIIKEKKKSGVLLSKIIGIKLALGQFIYFLDSDDMITSNDALSNLYKLSQTFRVDTIEYLSIHGEIGKYDCLIDIVHKKSNNNIISGKNILNWRYEFSHQKQVKLSGITFNKLTKKRITDKVILYIEKNLGLNNISNWNYGEDQLFVDLTMIFSETYLHVNHIYHYYYKNPKSLSQKPNREKIFQGHYKYIYQLVRVIKEFKINFDYLMINIYTFILNLGLHLTEFECNQFLNLIKEIKIEKNNCSDFCQIKYSNIIHYYNHQCEKYKLNHISFYY